MCTDSNRPATRINGFPDVIKGVLPQVDKSRNQISDRFLNQKALHCLVIHK